MRKKYIIMIIIILLFLIGILAFIIYRINNPKPIEGYTDVNVIETDEPINKNLVLLSSKNDYYIIKTCINEFLMYNTETEDKEETELNNKVLLELLDNEYISYKGIDENNLESKIEKIKKSVININKIYISQQNENISLYIAECNLREKTTGNISNLKIMVKLDSYNRTFSIFLEDFINNKFNEIYENKEIQFNADNIEIKQNNVYEYKVITDNDYVIELFNKYKEEILYNTDLAYEHLDNKYREIKFGTLEDFKKYTRENIIYNVNSKLSQFEIKVMDGYTQYVCVDQNGKYYIFNEESTMNYTMLLDIYTVDTELFLERYNKANSIEKGGYNIEKCIEAINNKDYTYVYNKLYDEFKNNNYKTEESFEKVIKNKLFDTNVMKIDSTENEGDIYIYNLIIQDGTSSEKQTNMKIIMQLKEETDFAISFSF